MNAPELMQQVAEVRSFNRFYTNVIGVLRSGLLDTPHSPTEARVIFELAQHESVEAADLRRGLNLDPGYLSRILSHLESQGLAARERSSSDARRHVVGLTDQGRAAFALLDERSAREVKAMLSPLTAGDRRRLTGAMREMRNVLDRTPRVDAFVLRPPEPGDLGWVVQRHGALYAREYGWDETFEALVARIVADYIEKRDPKRECAWIAEVDGSPAGCVFCVRKDETTAQLRLLLVEPAARGTGIGSRLVDECMRFARRAGYRRMTLWTNDVLEQARRIYERAGFELLEEESHHSFGHDLVGQYWGRSL